MTYTLRFLPDVEEDVMAGYAWYEEKATGLGEDFLRAAHDPQFDYRFGEGRVLLSAEPANIGWPDEEGEDEYAGYEQACPGAPH